MYEQSADAASPLTPPSLTNGAQYTSPSDPDGSVRYFSAPDQPRKKLTVTRARSAAADYPCLKFLHNKLDGLFRRGSLTRQALNSIWVMSAFYAVLSRKQSSVARRASDGRFYGAVGGDLIKRGTSVLFTHSLARAARRSYLSAISCLAALAAGSSILSASRRASCARKCQCIGSVSNSGTGSPSYSLYTAGRVTTQRGVLSIRFIRSLFLVLEVLKHKLAYR